MTALSADQRTESTRPQRPQPEELALKTTSSFSSVGASMVVGGGTAPATATAVALEEGVVPSPTILRRRSTTRQAAASVTTDATRRMICGGLAGMIAKTATNPLERIKMLSQTGEHSMSTAASSSAAAPTHHRPTIIGLYRDILRNEGIWGLWAGNGANLIRVFPSKAIVFSSNDLYKHFFEGCVPSKDHRETYAGPISFVAGGMAGMTASACTYPLDLTRGRISGKLGVNGRKMYGGIWQTMALTIKDEGFFALYKGVTPTLMGAMPYEGIKFGTVGLLEKAFPPADHNGDGRPSKPDPLRKMMFGGMGGVMAGFLTYPNDTVRRMLQLQGSRGTTTTYSGYWDCVRQTIRTHGVSRLYRGLTINVIRMAPNAAVQFGSYELLKQWTAPRSH